MKPARAANRLATALVVSKDRNTEAIYSMVCSKG